MGYKIFERKSKSKTQIGLSDCKNWIKRIHIKVNSFAFPSKSEPNFLTSLLFVVILVFSNCTTVGFHDDKIRNSMDFGAMQDLNVCVFYEDTIDKSELAELEKDWANELALYKIKLQFKKTKQVSRFAFLGVDVLDEMRHYKLNSECDRLVYLIGRTWGDIGFEIFSLGIFAFSGIKLEIHGAVESASNTRGVVKAKYASLLQLLFTSPSSTLIHEGYHLMGCPHMLFKDECYKIILNAKNRNKENKKIDKIFSVRSTRTDTEFYSSEQVNYFWGSKKNFDEDNNK